MESKAIIFITPIRQQTQAQAASYVADNLKAIPRPDIKLNMELVKSCWAEIDAGKGKKKMSIGCIYKHPTCNL